MAFDPSLKKKKKKKKAFDLDAALAEESGAAPTEAPVAAEPAAPAKPAAAAPVKVGTRLNLSPLDNCTIVILPPFPKSG